MNPKTKAILDAIDNRDFKMLYRYAEMRGEYSASHFYEEKYLIYNRLLDYITDERDENALDEFIKRIGNGALNIPIRITDVIRKIGQEYADHCIERRKELGLSSYDVMCILRSISNKEHADKWILKRNELELNNLQVVEIINSMDDPQYTDSCIERRKELGLDNDDIVSLINNIRRIAVIDKWVQRRGEIGLNTDDVYRIVLGLNNYKYTEKCIEERKKLGFNSSQISDLISGIGGRKYIKDHLERSESLGLESIDVAKLILRIPLMSGSEQIKIIDEMSSKLDSRSITLLLETWQLFDNGYPYIKEYMETRNL